MMKNEFSVYVYNTVYRYVVLKCEESQFCPQHIHSLAISFGISLNKWHKWQNHLKMGLSEICCNTFESLFGR